MDSPDRTSTLAELQAYSVEASALSLRACFADDPNRAGRFTFDAAGVHLDLSKQLITEPHLDTLLRFARACDLERHRDVMASGAPVNRSEGRGALHLLHRSGGAPNLEKVRGFVESLRHGDVLGATGAPLRVVVNLGIGGSDLGPRMAHSALGEFDDRRIDVRFASSLDPTGLEEALEGVSADEVLFVAATKSFSTLETGVLAHRAIDWLHRHLGPDAAISQHLAAVTARHDLAERAGIAPDRIFTIDEGIGGRYSLSSAMGLPVMAAIGTAAFDELLAGFAAMDAHFTTTPLEANLPVLHGLVGFWNRSILGFGAQAIVPYAWNLRLLPDHLAQLVMESNGKSTDHDGQPVALATSPVLFGAPGTEAQHSFFQLLHQGTDRVPVDLIAVAQGAHGANAALMANLLAQAQGLAFGDGDVRAEDNGASDPQAGARTMNGDRPSTVVGLTELTPRSLGALLGFYEHSVFTQAVLWGINPFDQFGVELGKVLAGPLTDQLASDDPAPPSQDGSTTALISWFRGAQPGE